LCNHPLLADLLAINPYKTVLSTILRLAKTEQSKSRANKSKDKSKSNKKNQKTNQNLIKINQKTN
jgi:hypothetical protein